MKLISKPGSIVLLSTLLIAMGISACGGTVSSSTAATARIGVSVTVSNSQMSAATSLPSFIPTPASLPTTISPTVVPSVAQTTGVCKSTNYCLQTDCRKDECLFASPAEPYYPVGIATVRGYYAKVERTSFRKTKLCDSFVIIGGSQVLINSYLSLIEAGNSVNSKNELNQPIISLELRQVEAEDRQKILASSQDNPIEVLLLSPIPPGRSAPVCYSSAEIIKVN
jgi:hypothetical protein